MKKCPNSEGLCDYEECREEGHNCYKDGFHGLGCPRREGECERCKNNIKCELDPNECVNCIHVREGGDCSIFNGGICHNSCTKESVKLDEEWEPDFNKEFLESDKDDPYPVPVESIDSATFDVRKLKAFISKISQTSFQRGKESGFSEGDVAELREIIKRSVPVISGRQMESRDRGARQQREISLQAFDTTLNSIKARKQSDEQE